MTTYVDYLMIICLPSELVKEISRYKQASVNAIGHFEAMHIPAYITITHQVRCKPFLAQPAIARMEQRISSLPPAELYLNGFGYFNHGSAAKTIYAQIEPTQRNENWFKLLAMQMGIKLKDFTPNVTIVKNIPATTFNKLWPNFHNRKFKYPFTVNSLTILHKDTFTEHDEWRVYRELSFGNKLSAF